MNVTIGITVFVAALLSTLPVWPRLRRWNPSHGTSWIVLGIGVVPVLASRLLPASSDMVLLPATGGFLVAGLITRRRDLREIRGE